MSLIFRQLVNRHQDQVFSLALYILGDRVEAEDVVQETYIKLWENLDRVDSDKARFWSTRLAITPTAP
ncbi:hypothetical protein FKG94_20305 [Exilibacterium tricleocarpae]|uniref:RNA polymerase sigma-70 region 2 domain-containing protein n=1 Tax=Exilibacterium tricleocarpae TaxID=2591008 RepID=A0A545T0C9_9GAMM|nr:sigma factor [Exilibacterium tricleocarpae]TQV70677.1 hypothetical protein FKG94_20305 [Exilibacterium tricleocarpae]